MLALVALASALTVRIEAVVDGDRVRGTLWADEPVVLIDPLARLPDPADDRATLRAFPGTPDRGEVRWTGEGPWTFEARLPRRYGDVGWTPGWGLRANGGWYPTPVDRDGRPRVATWDVDLRAEGTVVVVHGVTGREVRWRGESDRVAIASLGRRVSVVERDGAVGWVGPARLRTRERLEAALGDRSEPVTVVLGPDFEHLARPAPGMVYLSHRALRLTGPLWRYHAAAVREAVFTAAAPLADGWERAFVGAVEARANPGPDPRKLLGWASWNPVVDALLYDGTLPFYGEVFDEAWSDVPGLWDGLDPRPPARAVVRQLDDAAGAGASDRVAAALLAGEGLELATAGLPAEWVAGWARPPVEGVDYRVDVVPGGVVVVRDAPPEAPVEPVEVTIDGEPAPVRWFGPGPDAESYPRGAVQVDADGHLAQADRSNDAWPPRWTVTLAGGLYDLSLTDRTFAFEGVAVFRRLRDNRNLWFLGAEHDAQDLAGGSVGWLHYLGPAIDRQTRAHRLYTGLGVSVLDPAFRPTDAGRVAMDSSLAWTWDTREGDLALHGRRLSVGVGGGLVPGSEETWGSAFVSGVQLVPLHPRHVLAVRGKAAWASGDVEHRLLTLGGANDVRGLPVDAALGNAKLLGGAEYRWAPLRGLSVPGPLLWGSELQLAPGVDVGRVWRDGGEHTAVGGTLGVHTVVDLLGARPVFSGVTVAWPIAGEEGEGAQLYVEFDRAF